MTRNDIIALLTQVAGFCALAVSAGFGPAIDSVFPGYGTKSLAVLGLIGLVAGTVVRIVSNPSPPPGTASVVTAAPSSTPVITANENVPTAAQVAAAPAEKVP